jgi:hypothetical protein
MQKIKSIKNTKLQAKKSLQKFAAMQKTQPDISEFLTTCQAAKLLSLSTATIQKLVNNHSLQAWKTPGGHRRIYLSSLLSYQASNNSGQKTVMQSNKFYEVFFVLESPKLVKQLTNEINLLQLPLKASFLGSLTQATLKLINQKHGLLITELNSSRAQQERDLKILQDFMALRQTPFHALVLTNETNLPSAMRPKLKVGNIQVVNVEASSLWIAAYLTGFVARPQN